jgi:hypothetical protein
MLPRNRKPHLLPKKAFRKIHRPWVEVLEDRTLPSGQPLSFLDGLIGPQVPNETIIPGYNQLVQSHPTVNLAVQPPLLPGQVPSQTIVPGPGQLPVQETNINTRTLPGSTQAMAPGLHTNAPPLGVRVIGNVIVNNPALDGVTSNFTQSTTTNLVFGNTIVVGYNDSESDNNSGSSSSKFTGYSISTDGGQTFTDLGSLPTNPAGDLGDPVLARDNTSGTVYFSTLAFGSFFNNPTIQVFRSPNGGNSYFQPVNAAPGITPGDFPDKEWLTVDNFAGAGQGNVYVTFTDFGSTTRITLTHSTDGGNSFGPNGGVTIATGLVQGSFVVVGPDHSVNVFWLDGNGISQRIMMRRSTDQGNTFGPAQVVVTLNTLGTNGDLGLGGFRTNSFPHVAVNPVTGDLYVTYNDRTLTGDRANIYFTQSADGGTTWTAPIVVNDDGTTTDQWQPAIAVKPNGTELFIAWYDRRNDPGNNFIDTFGVVADINTATHAVAFQPNFRISSTSFPPVFGVDPAVNRTYMGDYDTASADNMNFYFTWEDNRDATAPDVRFARIRTGMTVVATTPATGSIVSAAPTDFVIHLSDPYDPAILQASDLTVNSIAANSVTQTDASTLTFHFVVSPVTHEGPQTIGMVANALQRLSDHDPLQAFTGTFYFDTLRLHVNSVSPAAGTFFNVPGDLILQFNEPVDPASVSIGNLVLNVGNVTAATVSPDHTTVKYTIAGAADGTSLTVTLPAGIIRDADGNPGPDVSFSASYSANVPISPYPTPLAPKSPPGSLIYDPSVSANIGFVGDTDSFTINLNPGQTAAVLVTPDANLQPSVKLIAPDGTTILGSAAASGSGVVAVLQAAPISTAGVYTFVVSGVNGATGAFSAQLLLNAAFQNESTIGPSNSDDSLAGAQDLTNAFIGLGNGASRAAVAGFVPGGVVAGDVFLNLRPISSSGQNSVALYDNNGNLLRLFQNKALQGGVISGVELSPDNTLYAGLDTSNGGFGGGGNGGELVHLDLNGNLLGVLHLPNEAFSIGTYYPFGFDVGPDGTIWVPQTSIGTVVHLDALGNLIRSYSVGGIPEDATVRADGQVFVANISLQEVQQLDPVVGNVTNFVFLSSPISVAFAASGGNGDLVATDFFNGIDYFNSSGVLDKFIPASNAQEGEPDPNGNTFVVSGTFTDLRKFDLNGNQLFNVGVSGIPTHLAVVGVDAPAPPLPDTTDYYSFTLAQGQSATLALKDLSPGRADFQLQDASGTPLALANLPNTNVDEVINNFVAGKAGTYYARITGNGVKYNLIITKGADFDTESNNSLANAQPLEGGLVALGNAGITSLLAKPGGPKVLYYVDFTSFDTFGQAFATLGITPTVATSSFDFETKLAVGGWDLVVLMDQLFFDNTWDVPVINWVNGGGRAIVASWTHPNDVGTAFGAVYTFNDNQSPITQTATDSVWNGIPNPFQLSNPNGGIWSTGLTATSGQSIGTFPNGDSGLVVGNSRRTILNGFLENAPSNRSQGVQLAENEITAVLTTNDVDTYSISAKAGDLLQISTTTPGSGPGQFHNTFDPKVSLYDPMGNLVASDDNSAPDGRNALLNYTVPAGHQGTYSVQVMASPLTATPTAGEYVLSVQGATGSLPPFIVTTTNPTAGSHVRSLAAVTVDFNDSILLTSLSASDLTVDGTPATGFTINNPHEVTWSFPALPGGDEVPHTLAIAGGVLSDIQGTPISTFSETIFIDTIPPLVVGTSIEEGNVLANGNLTYNVTFSEQMLTSVTTSSSFDLHGNFRSVDYTPTSFSWNAAGKVLNINYANLPDDGYKLTLFSNGFEDLVAFHLDGEPHTPRPPSVPSGDGVEGGDFFIDFALDTDTVVAYPTPLSPKAPSGSLIYDPTVTNVIAPAGDSDQFTLNVNAGQTMTVVVQSPTLQGTITLTDPNGKQIGSGTASAVGKDAVLQTVPVTVGGTYTLSVGGASGTTGLFTARIILNSAVQNELHGGPSDDTIATAQDLTSAFLSLGTAGGSRAAVLGEVPGGAPSGGVVIGERKDQFGSPGGQIVILDNFGNLFSTITNSAIQAGVVQDARLGPDNTIYLGVDTAPGSGQGGEFLHFDLSGNLLGIIHLPNDPGFGFYYPFGFAVAPDGTFWVPQPNSGHVVHVDASGNLIRSYFVGGNAEDAAVRSDGQVFIANTNFGVVQQLDPVSGSVSVFTFQASIPVGVTFASVGGNGSLVVSDFFRGVEFFDTFGNQVNFIPAFLASKSETDPNSNVFVPSFAFQDLRKFTNFGGFLFDQRLSGPPIGVAVFGVDAPPPPPPDTSDYYSFTLAAGQSTTIALSDVSSGLANVDLENAAGTILAFGQAVGTSVTQAILDFAAPASGTYYVHVTGSGVQYNLVVTRAATFSLGSNHSSANSQDVTNTNGVLSAIGKPPAIALGANFNGLSFNDTLSGGIPPDGALAVGSGYIMEGVNTAVRITDMSGNNLLTEEFSTFFSSLSPSFFQTDPYIAYDDIAQRWYVIILDAPNGPPPFGTFSDVLFAVSNDANPLHGFTLQERIHIGSTDFLDFPKMGFNHDAVVITANDSFFGFFNQSLQVVAIDKNALLSGTFTDYISQRDSSHFRAEVPAWMHGSLAGDPMYLVEEAGYGNGFAARVVTMTNILSNTPAFTDTNIAVNPYFFAPPANQPGQPFSVATNDTTFTRADWRNGKLVSAQTVSEPDDGFTSARVRWYEFDTTGAAPTLVQQGSIHPGPGVSTYFGSVAINANGDLGLTYMESSLSEFVSMYVTGRQAGDPMGTMKPGILVAPGISDGFFFRAGDYSGIAVDPNGSSFWAENEYQGNTLWNTYVASFNLAPRSVEDWYQVTLPQYFVLRATTSTPSDGPGQFHNTLNPHIDVFDSSGNLLASGTKLGDGRNEALGFTAPTAGTYFFRVTGQNGTTGEYFLNLVNAGIVLLDSKGSASFNGVGNTGIVRTQEGGGGAMVIDSNSSTAAVLTGNAFATAGEFDITGAPGTSTSGNATFTGAIHSGMPAMADPLALLPAPSAPSPKYSAVNYSGSAPLTLNPGTYVGGIHITGSGPVTLLPGIYFMQGGGFSLSGQANVTGSGVMIYNSPSISSDAISVSQGSLILTAPSSGTYLGIAIFQKRTSNVPISVSGTGVVNVTGMVYAAKAMVSVSGNGVFNIFGPNSRLVGFDLMISGNGFFDPELRAPDYPAAIVVLSPDQPLSRSASAAPMNGAITFYPEASVFRAGKAASTAVDTLVMDHGPMPLLSTPPASHTASMTFPTLLGPVAATSGRSRLMSQASTSTEAEPDIVIYQKDSRADDQPAEPAPLMPGGWGNSDTGGVVSPLWNEELSDGFFSRLECLTDGSDASQGSDFASLDPDLDALLASIVVLIGGFQSGSAPVETKSNSDRQSVLV